MTNHTSRRLFRVVALAVPLWASFGLSCLAGPISIYFYDLGTPANLRRINSDGTGLTTLLSQGAQGTALKIDVAGNSAYFADLSTDRLYRSNLDGTGLTTLVNAAGSGLFDIALDTAGGKLYWSDGYGNVIKRSDLNGTNVQTLVTAAAASFPFGLDLDLAAGKMYWGDLGGARIRRADLDGTNVTTLLSVSNVRGLALDVAGGKMYWGAISGGNGVIQRANLDGTGTQTLFTSGSVPAHLVLDLQNRQVYWTDENAGGIRSGNMDGSGSINLIPVSLAVPYGIDLVVPEPSTSVLAALTLGGLALLRRRR